MSRLAPEADPNAPPPQLYHERRWYACYTRARHEKRVEEILLQRGFPTYLPLYPRPRQWKDRKKIVDWPLFPSYVFAQFALSNLHRVLTTPGVATIVRVNGYPTPIEDDELENVRRFARILAVSGLQPKPVPFFQRGQPVRIVAGPFAGIAATVVERRGRRRVLVGLHAIGQGLEVDVDASQLRPAS